MTILLSVVHKTHAGPAVLGAQAPILNVKTAFQGLCLRGPLDIHITPKGPGNGEWKEQ